MTASPTVECVETLHCRAYVCDDELIEEFQANAEWELLFYPVRITCCGDLLNLRGIAMCHLFKPLEDHLSCSLFVL